MKDKLYVVKKYVKAASVEDALKKEKTQQVDSVYIDADWVKGTAPGLAEAVGFFITSKSE